MSASELGGVAVVAAIVGPLVVAGAIFVRALRTIALRLAPWAAFPAVLLATGAVGTASIDGHVLLLGARLGVVDRTAQTFLLLTAGVWFVSSVFARAYMAGDPQRARFWIFFLVTMAGNVGLVLAQDVASFYCLFAVMTFASYGIIVHTRTPAAHRAGTVYIVMALLGEMVLVAALFLIVADNPAGTINVALADVPRVVAASARRELIVALVLVGFGVKAGALVVHVWLPLAHPVAPTPASAVLSGAMIKAGLLAWLRLLPLGLVALPTLGLVCVAAGMTAAFYGMMLGLCQRDGKTVLAYSSISQVGFMTATLGVALAVPEVAETAIAALLFYAIHHAFAKAALFLGTGLATVAAGRWAHRLVVLGLLVPALDLAGAPLSSGALAKLSVKDVVEARPWEWAPLGLLLSLGSVGSTILMAHFLRVLAPRASTHSVAGLGLWIPWLALLVVDIVVVVRSPIDAGPATLATAKHVWSALWPILAGSAIYLLAWAMRERVRFRRCVPPGDVLVLFERGVRALRTPATALWGWFARLWARLEPPESSSRARPVEAVWRALQAGDAALSRFSTIGVLFLLLAGVGLLVAWQL